MWHDVTVWPFYVTWRDSVTWLCDLNMWRDSVTLLCDATLQFDMWECDSHNQDNAQINSSLFVVKFMAIRLKWCSPQRILYWTKENCGKFSIYLIKAMALMLWTPNSCLGQFGKIVFVAYTKTWSHWGCKDGMKFWKSCQKNIYQDIESK